MQTLWRMIAALSMFAVTAALAGAHAVAFSTTPRTHPAGCHSTSPETPSPAPATYQCCANGHNWALLTASFSPCPPIVIAPFQDASDDLLVNYRGDTHPQIVAFLCGSPPDAAPLRI